MAVDDLITDRPRLHIREGRDVSSFLTPAAMHWLNTHIQPDMRTVETGCGASTIIFAQRGSMHTVISPDHREHERIVVYCRENGIDTSKLTFLVATSDRALPTLTGEFDVALIDGAHSFPIPIVDFHYLSGLLRVGGYLVLDDNPFPSVGVLTRHLRLAAEWELVEFIDDRASVWRKLAHEDLTGDPCFAQPFNRGYPDYSFLPLTRRTALAASRWFHAVRGWFSRALRPGRGASDAGGS